MLNRNMQILLPSDSSGEWLYHIWGAMDMIQVAHLRSHLDASNTGHLLDWVYYHDTLSRFALQHWRHKSIVLQASGIKDPKAQDIQILPLARYRPVCFLISTLKTYFLHHSLISDLFRRRTLRMPRMLS